MRKAIWKLSRHAAHLCIRLHEAPTELAQAGVEQRVYLGSRLAAHVLRPEARASSGETSSSGPPTSVSSSTALTIAGIDHHFRLGLGILQDFLKLRVDSQAKNIAAWTPVVAEILQGFVKFDDKAVSTWSSLLLDIPAHDRL